MRKPYYSTLQGRARNLWWACKQRARRKGIPFTLNLDVLIAKMEPEVCQLTGLPLVLEMNDDWRIHPLAPSVDRIDSAKGYTNHNTQVIAFGINSLKAQYPTEVVRVLAKAYINATKGTKI